MPLRARKAIAGVIQNLHRNHCHCLALRRLTLPGMIDEPARSRVEISHRCRSEGPKRASGYPLAIFISEAASVLYARMQKTISS